MPPSTRRPMAIASHKPAVQPAAARRAPAEAAPAQAVPEFSKEQELTAFRNMLRIRRFEEKAGQLYAMGRLGGFCHLYIGEEAVVVGMQLVLQAGAHVATGSRDHG